MDRWRGRVAVVTGASAGIGAAVAVELARKGMKVAGLARRADKVQELSGTLDGALGQLFAVACDLAKEEDILAAFEWVTSNLGGVDVLVNNAGVLHMESLTGGDSERWRQMLKVNVLALSICTREAVKLMKNRKVDGHIIHVNSVAGHGVGPRPEFQMYTATKHAVTALTEGLRLELVSSGSKIKVTSLSPGVVHTEMTDGFADIKGLQSQDLANSVVFILSTPPHVQIHEMMMRAVPEVFPKFPDSQPDFPLEFQRGSPPERAPEISLEIPPENPPEIARESPPEIPPEIARDSPPENPPEILQENPPETPLEITTRDSAPENPSDPDPESGNPPEPQPENTKEPNFENLPEDQNPEKPPEDQQLEKPTESPQNPPEGQPEKPSEE